MQRLFASLLFCAAATFVSAQSRDIKVVDTDAMKANADKHTTMVDQAASLSADQKTQVHAVYMDVERQMDALNQRYTLAGLSDEDRAAEMAPQWGALERMVDTRLAGILSAEQMTKWREVAK